jgi:hypothetical protein
VAHLEEAIKQKEREVREAKIREEKREEEKARNLQILREKRDRLLEKKERWSISLF